MREKSRHLILLLGSALGIVAASTLIAACGGGESGEQFAAETPGDYPVEVLSANFKRKQTISETYDMLIRVRNTGDETIPAINATIDLPGRNSTLAFAYRNRQPQLASPQRPIWVMEEGYPKLAGTIGRGGAATANKRTFQFGELPPGEVAAMVWRVTAVQSGRFELAYQLSAGLGLDTQAVDAAGEQPAGTLPVRIDGRPKLTKVNKKGNVVELTPSEQLDLKLQEAN